MNSVDQPNHTYYSCEDLFLDYLDKLNQRFAQQFSDYLKDAYTNNKKGNNREEDNYKNRAYDLINAINIKI